MLLEVAVPTRRTKARKPLALFCGRVSLREPGIPAPVITSAYWKK